MPRKDIDPKTEMERIRRLAQVLDGHELTAMQMGFRSKKSFETWLNNSQASFMLPIYETKTYPTRFGLLDSKMEKEADNG